MNISEFLNFLFENLQSIIEFSKTYVPELGKEAIEFISTEAAVLVGSGIALTLVSTILFTLVIKGCKYLWNNDEEVPAIFIAIIGTVICMIALCAGASNIVNELPVMLHPEGSLVVDTLRNN